MKALLLLLAVTTLTMVGCVVPCVEYSSQSYQPAQRPFYQSNRSYCDGYQTYTVGPQYRRAVDNGYGPARYKNYSDAPVIVKRPGQSNIIVPHSWD